ncbi:MAG: HAMP domain-containing histidine kinase [Deltaproteobacteria bacterium]|nr:HAMP domain-containing histidine kinase [Deltaproteobacteria bacterium]
MPHGVDRYFLVLRFGSLAAAVLWLRLLSGPGATTKGLLLIVAFAAYSAALFAGVWRRPDARAAAYLAALPADLVFLFLVCRWSAEPMSGAYLAFYLLIALHAFYFGMAVGLAAALFFASLYASLYLSLPAGQRCSPEELLLRLGFAFLVAVSLALVSRELRAHRRRLADANRQLEQRNRILEQTYRHLSLGRLAGAVAHNINNPAAAIVAKADALRRRAEREGLPPVYVEDAATIAAQAFRIAGIVRSLLALSLSPRSEGPLRSVDLGAMAEGVVILLEDEAAERRVSIERRLAEGILVRAQEAPLRQVILNLLSNALDAVGDGGQVTVETARSVEPRMVELRVRDDGPGIAAENLDDIFNPFFTTKAETDGVGVGLGLGLSQSLIIVRRLEGTISVESAPGSGTTFTVTLPAAPAEPANEAAA